MKLSVDKLKDFSGKDKLVVLFLVGLIILIICIPSKSNGDKNSTYSNQEKETDDVSKLDQESYKKSLEEELEKVLSSAYGVGKVKVMITLESGSENIVKEDTKVSSSNIAEEDTSGGKRSTKEGTEESTTVYENENGNTSPYIVKEKMPAIAGVLVVAEGGGQSDVIQNISDAVKALFNVEAHKIKVMKMN